MLAKVPGGPRSHAMKPTMPTSNPNPMVPAWLADLLRILLIVFEEVSVALCLLRRSNIFVLQQFTVSSFPLCTITLINASMLNVYFTLPCPADFFKLFSRLLQKDVDLITFEWTR